MSACWSMREVLGALLWAAIYSLQYHARGLVPRLVLLIYAHLRAVLGRAAVAGRLCLASW